MLSYCSQLGSVFMNPEWSKQPANQEQAKFSKLDIYGPPVLLLSMVVALGYYAFNFKKDSKSDKSQPPVNAPANLEDESIGSTFHIRDANDSRGVKSPVVDRGNAPPIFKPRTLRSDTNPFKDMTVKERIANFKALKPSLIKDFVSNEVYILPNSEEIAGSLDNMSQDEVLETGLKILNAQLKKP